MATSKDLIDSMMIIAKKIAEEQSYDKTYTGRILAINSNNTYKVEVNQIQYDLPLYIQRTLKVNETVKVTFPLNNSNNAFIL